MTTKEETRLRATGSAWNDGRHLQQQAIGLVTSCQSKQREAIAGCPISCVYRALVLFPLNTSFWDIFRDSLGRSSLGLAL